MDPHPFYSHHVKQSRDYPSLFLPTPKELRVRFLLTDSKRAEIARRISAGERVYKRTRAKLQHRRYFVANRFGLIASPKTGGHAMGSALLLRLFLAHLIDLEFEASEIQYFDRRIYDMDPFEEPDTEDYFERGSSAGLDVLQRSEDPMTKGVLAKIPNRRKPSAFRSALIDFLEAVRSSEIPANKIAKLKSGNLSHCFFDAAVEMARRDLVFRNVFIHKESATSPQVELEVELKDFLEDDRRRRLRQECRRTIADLVYAMRSRRTQLQEMRVIQAGDGQHTDEQKGNRATYRRFRHWVEVKPNETNILLLLAMVPLCHCNSHLRDKMMKKEETAKPDRNSRFLEAIVGGRMQAGDEACSRCGSEDGVRLDL